jgi:hypothetical protein
MAGSSTKKTNSTRSPMSLETSTHATESKSSLQATAPTAAMHLLDPEAYLREFDEVENKYEEEARSEADLFNQATPQLGFTRTTKQFIEIPKELLDRVLLADERVLGQYDVLYLKKEPSHYMRLFYTILTCGLYLFYTNFLLPCFRYIR